MRPRWRTSTPKAGLVQPELAYGPGVGSAPALPSRRGHPCGQQTALRYIPGEALEEMGPGGEALWAADSLAVRPWRGPEEERGPGGGGGLPCLPWRRGRPKALRVKQCQSTRFMVYPSTIQQSWAFGGAHAPAFKAYLVAAVRAALHNRSTPPALLCDVTATVDWCEENYVHTPFIAELWNTASSVPMVLAGLWGLYKARVSVASAVCASRE
jgi:hypothetical protein